jgi:hypothetical protein
MLDWLLLLVVVLELPTRAVRSVSNVDILAVVEGKGDE